ncbi:MAG: phage virion morphogenesis protein [Kiritimatiellae bacterium]|nr:phage virion morphogenesis protein [Kiritimatiellia bacterium]
MNIEITVDTSRLDRMMADFPDAMARAQRNALVVIGNSVKNLATDAFKNPALRPSPWAPRKNNADPGRPLLYKHGDLQQNFRSVVTGPDTVVVGTKVEYARYHQHGTKKMPARPFLPVDKSGQLTPDCMREIKEAVEEAFAIELRKIGLQ